MDNNPEIMLDMLLESNIEYIIVQAGGRGSRLGYLTRNKPKALVPVENKPMIFHLFDRFPEARFVIIADYKKEVMREYLIRFAKVKYQIVYAKGSGNCAGIKAALKLIPEDKRFMIIWSDLILPEKSNISGKTLDEYANYIGISKNFLCRYSYKDKKIIEKPSYEHGIAGLFSFKNKSVIRDVPASGEFVQWLSELKLDFTSVNMIGTQEYGLLEAYEKLRSVKCRPFNRITVENGVLLKTGITEQGRKLAVREKQWYQEVTKYKIEGLPKIYSIEPLKMEYVDGSNIYDVQLSFSGKRKILKKLIETLKNLHSCSSIFVDTFSLHEAYYNKTMKRLEGLQDMIPLARNKYIRINERNCRNVYFFTRQLEEALDKIVCKKFKLIHGDCTFSNLMIRKDGRPVLIDPRGYFGFKELYGDVNYDWAKMYYSIVGNYDKFNLSKFHLEITDDEIKLDIASNHWEDMEEEFFKLTGADEKTIKLLHALIWLSFTTYAWQNYDSICGAFYNGLYYLEEAL